MAKFAGTRQHVEFPQELAGLLVVPEYVARHVFDSRLVVALFSRIADDDDVAYDDRWG